MKIIKSINEMQGFAFHQRTQGRSIGFIPTMGALHEGHRALVRRARQENDVVVVSIFVNPLQFGPKEDFKRYPRRLAQDRELLEKERVDVLFVPSAEAMAPNGMTTTVEVPAVSQALCGPFRP